MKRKLLQAFSSLLIAITLFSGCESGVDNQEIYTPNEPDYANANMWFDNGDKTHDKAYDVFYILPTSIANWVTPSGDTTYYADPENMKLRAMMQGSYEIADDIFGESCNFYSPYYRQISIESWAESEEEVDRRFELSFSDVKRAFDYYMNNFNNGKPIVLAGFSQGGKGVVELLKTFDSTLEKQIVASYVIGYRVTEQEAAEYEIFEGAQGADDIGVVISYNSVDSPEAILELASGSVYCINPVSWSTSTETVAVNDTVNVHVDRDNNVLILEGLDADAYYRPELGYLFKKGNYHLLELPLYEDYLRENVALRTTKFSKNSL